MRAAIAAFGLVVGGCSFTPLGDSPDGGVGDDVPPDAAVIADAPVFQIDAPAPPDAPVVPPADAAPDAEPDAEPDAAPLVCPPGYTMIEGAPPTSMYRTGPASTWLAAEQACENDGAGTHLVVLADAAESAAIDPLITGGLWVGVSDRVTEGEYLAITGGVAGFLPWAFLQPDNFFDEDCVVVNEGAVFVDIDCDTNRPFVCECDGAAADPTTF